MAAVSGFRVRPDQEAWLTLPMTFPFNDLADDLAWAAEVAQDRAAEGAPAAVRTAIAESALALVRADPPLPGVQERFWWMPSIGRTAVVAHLTAVELDDSLSAEPLDSFAQLGVGGLVQVIAPIEGSPFEEALDCVLIIPLGEESIALRRQIGRQAGTLVLMDVFVEDGVALYVAEQDVSALFASIQLR